MQFDIIPTWKKSETAFASSCQELPGSGRCRTIPAAVQIFSRRRQGRKACSPRKEEPGLLHAVVFGIIFQFSLIILAARVAVMNINTTANNQATPSDDLGRKDISGQEEAAAGPEADSAPTADAVRAKLMAAGISEQDVADAITWARTQKE